MLIPIAMPLQVIDLRHTLKYILCKTELNEISTNAVSRGGYEPTTVPIT
jgi:hypothetical protein